MIRRIRPLTTIEPQSLKRWAKAVIRGEEYDDFLDQLRPKFRVSTMPDGSRRWKSGV